MFYLNIQLSIGSDARKSFEMAANKFQENQKAKRVADELQLMRAQEANELFSRLYPEIERLTRNRVDAYAHDARVGNILSVTALSSIEILVSRKEQNEVLRFSFDSLTREVQIAFEGKVCVHRVLRVETNNSGTKPILVDQSRPDEPFVPISWHNLPRIVGDCVGMLLV